MCLLLFFRNKEKKHLTSEVHDVVVLGTRLLPSSSWLGHFIRYTLPEPLKVKQFRSHSTSVRYADWGPWMKVGTTRTKVKQPGPCSLFTGNSNSYTSLFLMSNQLEGETVSSLLRFPAAVWSGTTEEPNFSQPLVLLVRAQLWGDWGGLCPSFGSQRDRLCKSCQRPRFFLLAEPIYYSTSVQRCQACHCNNQCQQAGGSKWRTLAHRQHTHTHTDMYNCVCRLNILYFLTLQATFTS